MAAAFHIFFHSPCFDGIVSAVLLSDFAERKLGYQAIKLHSVNYASQRRWTSRKLPIHSAVVDFLYHPRAEIWVDHHQTTFIRDADRKRYAQVRNDRHLYDPAASSCAVLIDRYLRVHHSFSTTKYRQLVQWADRIDSATYRHVSDAIGARAAALQINRSLALDGDSQYCEWLVSQLRKESLTAVANKARVRKRVKRVSEQVQAGLRAFKSSAHLEDGDIVVFDVDADAGVVSRYAPYYFFPQARYSVGVMRHRGDAKVTAMRNPWKDFASVPIGPLLARFGGGGHQRVGSIVLKGNRKSAAPAIVQEVVAALK